MNQETLKYTLKLKEVNVGANRPNKNSPNEKQGDFYINIPLVSNLKKQDEYINKDRDPSRTIINRSDFNPFFIELGFFSTIKSVGSSAYTETNTFTDAESIYKKTTSYNITINK